MNHTTPAPLLTMGEALDDEGALVPALGFSHQGTFIVDPHASECGRYEVDPVTYYGLTPAQISELDAAKRNAQ